MLINRNAVNYNSNDAFKNNFYATHERCNYFSFCKIGI